jgi:PKD repeat protein
MMLSGSNPNEAIDTTVTPTQLAGALVGPGIEVSNVVFTGGAGSTGTFNFTDPTVVGFAQGVVMTSGSAADVVGPNLSESTSTNHAEPPGIGGPGDADLDALAGFTTYDAAVLEFDFVPTANQVVFQYAFASEEYPEWVNTDFNDVFAFYVNGTNHAVVRQVAGDPASLFVPVAVNNINNGNPLYPDYVPARPDLFRPNYLDPNGPSLIDLEQDGITSVLTFQAPVNPGVINHMKLAIADASDGVYDSAVFIQAGSIVSNENPVADLSVAPESGSAPLAITAFIEGEDPNGDPLTYSVNWGDGTVSNGPLNLPSDDSEKTASLNHTYDKGGHYTVTLTVSNGTLAGTSTEDVEVFSAGEVVPAVTAQPTDQAVPDGGTFTFSASASGTPVPTVQWQVSTDAGQSFTDIPGATGAAYTATAALADSGNRYRAVFTNGAGSATTDAATLTVNPAAPIVTLKNDTGASSSDKLTNDATLNVSGVADGATVEYSTDGGGTWGPAFTPAEGPNTVLVRQAVAGNDGDATTFTFTLDTTPPALSPSFSKSSPFLVNETGITASANATDGSGIFAESAGAVDTSSAGRKSVTCTATDNAGNTASADLLYTVGYGIINVLPAPGATFGTKDHVPVSFQLVDAGGLISDASAAGLLQDIRVAFDGMPWVGVKYSKKTDTFSATLKTGKPAPGAHDVLVSVVVGGDVVASKDIPVIVV